MLGFEIGKMMIWGFPSMGVPKNGWFMREYPIKITKIDDLYDLGVPPFTEDDDFFF